MRLVTGIVLAGLTITGSAQITKYSNEFLNIGVGARALGMSNAQVVSAEGAYAGYWNPAGLLSQKNPMEVALMHAEYFAGIAKYDFGALTKRIDSNSVAGISLIRFGVDNIPNTLELIDANGNADYSKVSTFSVVDFAALLSYARRIPQLKNVELGANFKVIRRRIGEFGGAWGFGMDAGLRYDYKKWKLGLMARDITGTFNAWSYSLTDKEKTAFEQSGNTLPESSLEITLPKLIIGATRTYKVWKDRLSLSGEINLINTFDGKRNTVIKSDYWSLEPAFGFEVGYKNLVFLRAGLGNIQKQLNDRATLYITTAQPNLGVGIRYQIFSLDYALTDIGDHSASLYSNIISLKIEISNKMNK